MFRVMIASALLATMFCVPVAAGLPIPPPGTDLRLCARGSALADRVVVGRVTAVEKDRVKAKPVPGVEYEHTYQIVRLTVNATLAGDKAATELRLGGIWIDPPLVVVQMPDAVQLPNPVAKDAEGLYFLERHHSGDFYTMVHFVPKYYGKDFDRDVKDAERYLKLLADPLASLQSAEAANRYATAVLLLMRHQAYRSQKTVPVSENESKHILSALAETDWGSDSSALHPYQLVHTIWRDSHIRATKPGTAFQEPVLPGKTAAERIAFLRDWAKKNRDTYRIERTVYE